ncbi:MAG TPA: hypothetical protein VGJ92_00815 [Methanocella sp.]
MLSEIYNSTPRGEPSIADLKIKGQIPEKAENDKMSAHTNKAVNVDSSPGRYARNDAFTRLEASILILAFIVVAALFTYFVAKAGIFSN